MAELWKYKGLVIYPEQLPEQVADLKVNVATLFEQTAGLESLADEMAMFDNAMRLTSDGVNVTHRCINTQLTQVMYLALKQAFEARAGELVGLSWFVVDSTSGIPIDSNVEFVVDTPFTLLDALSLLGLTVYQEEIA